MTYSRDKNEKPLITHSSYGSDNPNRGSMQLVLSWMRKRNNLVVRVIGIIGALATAYFLVSGIASLVQNSTQKDENGYFPSWKFRIEKPSYAIVFDPEENWVPVNDVGNLKIQVTPNDLSGELFVGVADIAAVQEYLTESDYHSVDKMMIVPDRATYLEYSGDSGPDIPVTEDFWTLRSTGTGMQEVRWSPRNGNTLVIMNADGSAGIDTKITLWTATAYKFMSGIGMLTAAFILGLLSFFIILSTRKSTNTVYPVPKMMLREK